MSRSPERPAAEQAQSKKRKHKSVEGKSEHKAAKADKKGKAKASEPSSNDKSSKKSKKTQTSKDAPDTSRTNPESSPPPYQPENVEELTAEQVKNLEASLQPEALAAERSKQMNLLSALMDPTGEISVKPKIKAAQSAEGQQEMVASSEAVPATAASVTEPAQKKARLALLERSKAPAASTSQSTWQPPARYVPPTESQKSAQPQPNPVEDDEDEEEEEAEVEEQSASKKLTGTGVKMNSLKEIFKPHEAGSGFSLGDMLGDAELEEDDYDPFAAFKPAEAQHTYAFHPQRYQAITAATSRPGPHQKATEASLFFPLCLEDEEDSKLVESLNLTAEQKARLEDRSWTSGSGRRFTKLGSSEDIAKRHEELRPMLTEQVRKRHREALRKTKRHRG